MDILVVAAAIVVGDRCLIGQRLNEGSFPGHWEFPGGKPEPGETQHQALIREIKEELDLDIFIADWLAQGIANTPSRRIVVDTYLAHPVDPGAVIVRRQHQALRFVTKEELDTYLWAPADLPALPLVKSRLSLGTPDVCPRITLP
jgi:8-oxo-dGTP diphosphatase